MLFRNTEVSSPRVGITVTFHEALVAGSSGICAYHTSIQSKQTSWYTSQSSGHSVGRLIYIKPIRRSATLSAKVSLPIA